MTSTNHIRNLPVLNPRIVDVQTEQKVLYLGDQLKLTVNSFETEGESYTLNFYEENSTTKEITPIYDEEITLDNKETTIEIPIEIENMTHILNKFQIRIGKDKKYEYNYLQKINVVLKMLFT